MAPGRTKCALRSLASFCTRRTSNGRDAVVRRSSASDATRSAAESRRQSRVRLCTVSPPALRFALFECRPASRTACSTPPRRFLSSLPNTQRTRRVRCTGRLGRSTPEHAAGASCLARRCRQFAAVAVSVVCGRPRSIQQGTQTTGLSSGLDQKCEKPYRDRLAVARQDLPTHTLP